MQTSRCWVLCLRLLCHAPSACNPDQVQDQEQDEGEDEDEVEDGDPLNMVPASSSSSPSPSIPRPWLLQDAILANATKSTHGWL
ncbi:hypothetical protein BS50DRAFT_579101 [Corynespora cassiicola Philippines]|uniref:Secreted protein n=1 Tax=Corynespora cassiicola Philippines TaxID=1448308 RepID=A0A2T2N5A3_CORCC|nr:hypothetical protein BS50DRAFT_579101 [Corynespora cassiicola Philippines]